MPRSSHCEVAKKLELTHNHTIQAKRGREAATQEGGKQQGHNKD